MPLDDARDLLAVLADHDLLPKAHAEEARTLAAMLPKAANLARELARRGLLTPFQVNEIFQGRAAGLVLGQYLLLDRLGQGGMGQVFKARHRVLDRLVALKVIRGQYVDRPEAVGRFQRECRAAGRLSHPNIVTVHDAHQAGSVHFLAMEHVEGKDLGRVLKERGRLPAAQACEYARQAALGLQHAHERGLVHRDVKPANLILTADGATVKVLDLGLARLRTGSGTAPAAEPGLTQDGAVVGTPDYLAPEQAGGDSALADVRADVYSLGCTLYHMLAGEPPFPGKTIREKLMGHLTKEPAALEQRRPDLPAGLAAVVRRMMAKEPAARYSTPGEVAAALQPYCGAGAVAVPVAVAAPDPTAGTLSYAASPATLPYVPPKRRGLPLWAALAGAALALLACPCAGFLGWGLVAPATHPGPAAPPVAQVLPSPGAGPAKDGNPPPNRDADPADPPVHLPPPPKQVTVRDNLPWPPPECVVLLGDNGGRHWGDVFAVAFRPDGKVIATTDQIAGKAYIHLWDVETLHERAAWTPAGVFGEELAFSPNGRLLTAVCGDGIRLWDAGDDGLTHERKFGAPGAGPGSNLIHLLFTADGQSLLAWDATGAVRKWRLTNGDPVEEGDPAPGPKSSVALAVSADGRTEAYSMPDAGTGKHRVWVRALYENGPADKTVELSAAAGYLALSADGKRLAARVGSVGAGELRLWNLDGDEPRPIKTIDLSKYGVNDFLTSFSFTPDGKRVALAVAPRSGAAAVWLFDAATGEGAQLDGLDVAAACLAFPADGRAAAVVGRDRRLRLWQDKGAGLVLRPCGPGAAGLVRRLAFRPGGNDLAVVSRLNDRASVFEGNADLSNLIIWDWTTGQSRQAFTTDGWFSYGAYSPDGSWLFACGAGPGKGGVGTAFREGFLRLWAADGLREEQPPKLPRNVQAGSVDAAAFDRAGKTLALLGGNDFARLGCVCDARPFRVRGKPLELGQLADSLALAPDGAAAATLATRRNGVETVPVVKLWDIKNIEKEAPIGAEPEPPLEGAASQVARRLTYSPDGKTLAALVKMGPFPDSPCKALLWDAATGKTRAIGDPKDKRSPHVEAFAFSPDGHLLATADADGRVALWQSDTLSLLHEWEFPGPTTAVAFSGGGDYLAVGDGDGTVAVLRLPSAGGGLHRRVSRSFPNLGHCPRRQTRRSSYTPPDCSCAIGSG